MKNKKLLIAFSTTILILMAFVVFKAMNTKQEQSIDLRGSNAFCTASLNIHKDYDCELILNPKDRVPRLIKIDLKVKDESLYTSSLEYTKNSNPEFLGSYMIKFKDTIAEKIKNNDDIKLEISFNDESSTLKLKDKVILSNSK